jgi:hypothetical protein
MTFKKFSAHFALLLVVVAGVRASDNVPAVRPAKPVLLRGGTVHTVSGADLPATDVLLRDGKIAAIGAKLAVPPGAAVVDVAGKHVYPGLISAYTGMGLTEMGSVRGSVDLAETGLLNPNARAQPALNPDSEHIPVSRSNGILTALSVPLTTGLVAGTSTLIRMDGWTWEDLTLRSAAALHVYWPNLTVNRDPSFPRPAAEQQKTIDENLKKIRDAFASARAYLKAKEGGGETDRHRFAVGGDDPGAQRRAAGVRARDRGETDRIGGGVGHDGEIENHTGGRTRRLAGGRSAQGERHCGDRESGDGAAAAPRRSV